MAHAKNIGEPFMAHAKNIYNIPWVGYLNRFESINRDSPTLRHGSIEASSICTRLSKEKIHHTIRSISLARTSSNRLFKLSIEV